MENIANYKPAVIAVILDLSSKHVGAARSGLETMLRMKLRADDLYYNVTTNEYTNVSINNEASNPVNKLGLTTAILKGEDNFRKAVILAIDYYRSFDYQPIINNSPNVNFYFLKVGKHNPEFEKNIVSNHSFYFNDLESLLTNFEEFLCNPVITLP